MNAPVLPFPIIDPHQHLWDLSLFELPWQAEEDVPALRRSFLMEDYLAATAGLNVVKSVYMEVDVLPAQQPAEAQYVLDLCARDDNPMTGVVVSCRPGTEEFEPSVRRLSRNRFMKGVRRVLHNQATAPGTCLQPKFIRSMRLLGDLGLSFDFCIRPGELMDAVRLVDLCPTTRFVLDHCGNLPVTNTDASLRQRWEYGLQELAERPNVVCKISGLVASANPGWTAADLAPNLNFAMNAFGEDRVMFAGDWPVCTLKSSYRDWVAALWEIVQDRSPTFQRKLFHDNALRFYRLDEK